jgi:hypothetical protein
MFIKLRLYWYNTALNIFTTERSNVIVRSYLINLRRLVAKMINMQAKLKHNTFGSDSPSGTTDWEMFFCNRRCWIHRHSKWTTQRVTYEHNCVSYYITSRLDIKYLLSSSKHCTSNRLVPDTVSKTYSVFIIWCKLRYNTPHVCV